MKRFIPLFVVAFALTLTLCANNVPLPITLNSKDWHISGGGDRCKLSTVEVEYQGKNVTGIQLQAAGVRKYVEARFSLRNTVDIEKYSHLNFVMKIEPVPFRKNDGRLVLRDSDWKQDEYSILKAADATMLTPGKWHTLSVNLSLSRQRINKQKLRQIALGVRPKRMFKDDAAAKLTVTILHMEFVHLKDPKNEAKMAAWNKYIKNYKPDYTDGSHLLKPPATGRIEKPLPIVKDGKAVAEIIVKRHEDSEPAITAAEELQHWIKEITGAKLYIRDKASRQKNTKIFIGKRVWDIAGKQHLFGDDLKFLSGSDGFAVRNIGNKLYIFGTEGKGALNGVYTLLENNTDIIWPRPYPGLNAVFSKHKDLDFVWGNHRERPASRTRGWNGYRDIEWMARNRCNGFYGGGGGDIAWMNKYKEKWGGHLARHLYGHNIGHFLYSKKYLKTNPEYFSLVNGKRKPWRQYCFSNKEMNKEFIKNVLDIARRAPEESDMITIAMDDTWDACECTECMKPITLPDASKLENTDPAFRSTQFFHFLNKVAEALHKEFPKLQLSTQAYFSTAIPPKIDVHPTIRPEFAPYVRVNDKTPLFSPENKMWLDRLAGWTKKSKFVDIYEYHGLGMKFPRPMAEVRAKDFREMYNLGIQGIQSEYRHRGDRPKSTDQFIWDVSAMEFWLISRLYWNPEQDVEKLRKYFIYRTFREAAGPMAKYYGTIRDVWFKDPQPSTLGATAVGCAKHYIINNNLEGKLRGYLEDAEQKAVHPVSKILVQRHRKCFEDWMTKAKAIKNPTLAVPLLRKKNIATFDNPVWKKVAGIDGFKKMYKSSLESDHYTRVKLLHDAKNLYIYYHGKDSDVSNVSTVIPQNGKEIFPECDHVEIFLSNQTKPGGYYLFAFDANGYKVELDGYDYKWNGKWDCKTRKTVDGWDAIVTIPFETINFNIGKDNKIKALIMREYHHGNATLREYSSWGGGKVHDLTQFGILSLMR